MRPLSAALLAAAVAAVSAPGSRPELAAAEDGYAPLFNGTDLTGWTNVNCAPGTFFVKDGEIVTTGQPTGFLRSAKQYENFELQMEWMHVEKEKTANSGLFVWGDPLPAVGTPYTRGIEVQVLINYPKVDWATNHGDVFAIHGATCKPDRPHPKGAMRCLPSENRVKGGGEWNHYKVVANDGAIKLHVNGKEVSGVSDCHPRKGYLALESEGAECHFKNIKIKELPTTNPKPEDVAKGYEGHKSMFTGLDLSGWKTKDGAWKAVGGHLKRVADAPITSEAKFAAGEFVFDWKVPPKATGSVGAKVGPINISLRLDTGFLLLNWTDVDGGGAFQSTDVKNLKPGTWARTVVAYDRKTVTVSINGKQELSEPVEKALPAGPITFFPAEGLEIMNVFVRDLKGK